MALGFFQKGLHQDIKTFVNFYPKCVVKRTIRKKELVDINLLCVPLGPFHTIIMDFITDLLLDADQPLSKLGTNYLYDTILTVTYQFSKAKILIPSCKDQKAADQATAFCNCIILYWGLLKVLVSNWDKRFMNAFQHEVYTKVGVRQLVTTSYHLSANRQSERTNATLEIAL